MYKARHEPSPSEASLFVEDPTLRSDNIYLVLNNIKCQSVQFLSNNTCLITFNSVADANRARARIHTLSHQLIVRPSNPYLLKHYQHSFSTSNVYHRYTPHQSRPSSRSSNYYESSDLFSSFPVIIFNSILSFTMLQCVLEAVNLYSTLQSSHNQSSFSNLLNSVFHRIKRFLLNRDGHTRTVFVFFFYFSFPLLY